MVQKAHVKIRLSSSYLDVYDLCLSDAMAERKPSRLPYIFVVGPWRPVDTTLRHLQFSRDNLSLTTRNVWRSRSREGIWPLVATACVFGSLSCLC